ncbi:MAG: hypothetical protein JWQ71_4287 [Pedosphaera sp.]|nr:hypothetical protein [Pedosphaera sp.]
MQKADVDWGSMGALDHRVIPGLLLTVLGLVLVTGMFLTFLVIVWRRRQLNSGMPQVEDHKEPSPYQPSGFRHSILRRPSCWLAIRNRNLLTVQSALALHNSKPCSWVDGLAGNGEQKLFLSPPVNGWILVIGSALPEPNEDVDVCFRFLVDLSRKVGHVQLFSANSMLNHHAWAQVENGHVVRAYAWAGRTLWNQGKTTQPEKDLAMKCYDYTEIPDISPFGSSEPIATNSDKVHFLAARWSIDPDEIDERFIEQEWGIVGEPSKLF